MLRGYRCIFIAAFGLALIAAAKPEGGNSTKAQEPTAQKPSETAAPAIPPLIRTLSADTPNANCGPNKYGSNDDLCAQWKAADSADSAARAAWVLGIFGLLIGGATLVAAIMAALYASDAAAAAKGSLAQSQHEARAWLSISVDAEGIMFVGKSVRFYYRVTISNVGILVAQNFKMHHAIYDSVDGNKKHASLIKRWDALRRKTDSAIQPGESISQSIWSFQADSNFNWDESGSNPIFHPALLIYISYNIGGEEIERYSKRTFLFAQRRKTPHGGATSSLLRLYEKADPIEFFVSTDRLPLKADEIAMQPLGSYAT